MTVLAELRTSQALHTHFHLGKDCKGNNAKGNEMSDQLEIINERLKAIEDKMDRLLYSYELTNRKQIGTYRGEPIYNGHQAHIQKPKGETE